MALGRRFHVVFFDLLDYLEQCVGGAGGEVGSHNPQSLQRVSTLCYPQPNYAQTSFYLAQLAEVHCALGQWEQGGVSVAEGLERVRDKGEWFYAADLYRFKGELLILQTEAGSWGLGARDQKKLGFHVQSSPLQTPPTRHLAPSTQEKREQEAEACFLQAIDIARTQTTKLFELRATMSLCRLWHAQGKTQRARQRLAETVGWFTEGFDTPELQKAHALLMTFH